MSVAWNKLIQLLLEKYKGPQQKLRKQYQKVLT